MIKNSDRVFTRVNVPLLIIDITGNYMNENDYDSNLADLIEQYFSQEHVNLRRGCFKNYSIFPQFICRTPNVANTVSITPLHNELRDLE